MASCAPTTRYPRNSYPFVISNYGKQELSSHGVRLYPSGAMPLLVSVVGVVFSRLAKFASLAQQAYAVAGGVAEEAISSIRTVTAFGLEERAEQEYQHQLKIATKNNIIQGNFVGVGIGMINFLIYAFYGLAFGFGSWLIHDQGLTQ